MKRNGFTRKPLAFIALWGFALTARAAVVVDSTGVSVDIPRPPNRIITLTPALGEMASEILGEDLDRIVGVTERTDFPPVLKSKTQVGSYVGFDLERILRLKPDLVLASADGNPKDKVLRLRELGIPVVVVNTTSFAEILQAFDIASRALHQPEVGAQLARQLKSGWDHFSARAKKRGAGPRVMLQIGTDPLVVAGRRSFLNEALEVLGAKNIYADLVSGYPRPAVEDVLRRNPDQIVIIDMDSEAPGLSAEVAKWRSYPSLKAVRDGKVKTLQTDALLRPSMRLLEGVSLLEKTLYGDRGKNGK